MKTELRLADHSVIDGAKIVELWYDGRFIGQITGADGPGVRIISKYALGAIADGRAEYDARCDFKVQPGAGVAIVEVRIF